MRIALVQFGDFREAFERLESNGEETYYAQKYSVDFVADLVRRARFVGVCSMLGDPAANGEVAPGLHAAVTPRLANGTIDAAAVIRQLDAWGPSHLILQIPSRRIVNWALARGVHLLPVLADSWSGGGLRRKASAALLARLLNDERISLVGNHNVPACLSTAQLGVRASKIAPWDWPHKLGPEQFPAKRLARGEPIQILYVGQLLEAKGPGDGVEAAAHLKRNGVDFRLTLVGDGEMSAALAARIEALGLAGLVELAGLQPHARILSLLKSATVSLVPSHHRYPEGFPMTIYEALATRTPLVVSDHPMFRRYLEGAPSARMVRERRPSQIAAAVKSFVDNPSEYEAASRATSALWAKIICPLSWGDLIEAWLKNPATARDRLKDHLLRARLEAEAAAEPDAASCRAA